MMKKLMKMIAKEALHYFGAAATLAIVGCINMAVIMTLLSKFPYPIIVIGFVGIFVPLMEESARRYDVKFGGCIFTILHILFESMERMPVVAEFGWLVFISVVLSRGIHLAFLKTSRQKGLMAAVVLHGCWNMLSLTVNYFGEKLISESNLIITLNVIAVIGAAYILTKKKQPVDKIDN